MAQFNNPARLSVKQQLQKLQIQEVQTRNTNKAWPCSLWWLGGGIAGPGVIESPPLRTPPGVLLLWQPWDLGTDLSGCSVSNSALSEVFKISCASTQDRSSRLYPSQSTRYCNWPLLLSELSTAWSVYTRNPSMSSGRVGVVFSISVLGECGQVLGVRHGWRQRYDNWQVVADNKWLDSLSVQFLRAQCTED